MTATGAAPGSGYTVNTGYLTVLAGLMDEVSQQLAAVAATLSGIEIPAGAFTAWDTSADPLTPEIGSSVTPNAGPSYEKARQDTAAFVAALSGRFLRISEGLNDSARYYNQNAAQGAGAVQAVAGN